MAGTAATPARCGRGSQAYEAVGVGHVLIEPFDREIADWLATVERAARAGEGMLS